MRTKYTISGLAGFLAVCQPIVAAPQTYGDVCVDNTVFTTVTETRFLSVTSTSQGMQVITVAPAATGPPTQTLSFVFSDGTTSWLNGAAPTISSYVVETTIIITVYPSGIASGASSPILSTITTTKHSTSFRTVFQTTTLSGSGSTAILATDTSTSESAAGTSPTGVSHSQISPTTVTGSAVTMTRSVVYASSTSTTSLESASQLTVSISSSQTTSSALSPAAFSSTIAAGDNTPAIMSTTLSVYQPVVLTESSDATSSKLTVHLTSTRRNNETLTQFPTVISSTISAQAAMNISIPGQAISAAAHSLPTFFNNKTITGATFRSQSTTTVLPSSLSSYHIVPTSGRATGAANQTLSSSPTHATSSTRSVYRATTSAIDTSSAAVSGVSMVPSPITTFVLSSHLPTAYHSNQTRTTVSTMPLVSTLATAISPTISRRYRNTSFGLAPTGTFCGELGDFVMNWDDEPIFAPRNGTTDITQAPPVFSPYDHFEFSEGFVYAPLPEEPFQPVTGPHLVVFISNSTGASNNVAPGYIHPGEIGAEELARKAFWFNAYSAYLGCDNEGPEGCQLEISGYTYQGFTDDEALTYRQNVTLSPCLTRSDCQLQQVVFSPNMRGLSGLQIRAFAGDEQRIWFMDNLSLGWFINTCEAGLQRATAH